LIEKRFATLIILSLIIVIAVLVCSIYSFQSTVKEINGKYNATINYWYACVQLTYTDETGFHSSFNFDKNLLTGLKWINSSTPKDATILCWWDYGHMVKAIGERNPIIRNPSHEIINSVRDPNEIKDFDSHEKIYDVASAFTTNNQTKLTQIMEKYNAEYIIVGKNDLAASVWLFKTVSLDYSDYLTNQSDGLSFTELGKNTMIAKLLDNTIGSGLSLVYQDQEMKIYKLE